MICAWKEPAATDLTRTSGKPLVVCAARLAGPWSGAARVPPRPPTTEAIAPALAVLVVGPAPPMPPVIEMGPAAGAFDALAAPAAPPLSARPAFAVSVAESAI